MNARRLMPSPWARPESFSIEIGALSTLTRRAPENGTLRWASRSLLAKDQQEQPQALPNADQAKAA
jgi:hypothetical protein